MGHVHVVLLSQMGTGSRRTLMSGSGATDDRGVRRTSLAVAVVLVTAMIGATLISPALEATAAGRHGHRAKPLGQRVQFGAFVDGMQADPGVLDDFEQLVGRRTDIASYYYGYGDVFPGPTERHFADGGARKVLVSWDMGATRFTDWTSGAEDAYLDEIAAAARAYPYPLYVRPWPEMNGDWQSFQPTASGDRPHGGTFAEFRAAWRYVVKHLRHAGATNLRWVFNPTADTYAETTRVGRIWPGKRYVDVLGLDGFNWGNSGSGLRWRSFPDIFRRQYRNLVRLDRSAPVWICETASKEPTVADGAPVDPLHSKAAWVARMLSTRGLSHLEAIVWFNADKERDWRVDSSRVSLAAIRAGLTIRRAPAPSIGGCASARSTSSPPSRCSATRSRSCTTPTA